MQTEKEQVVRQIERMCVGFLTAEQIRQVSAAITIALQNRTISAEQTAISTQFAISNEEYVRRFLAIKAVKGCSERTLGYYTKQLRSFFLAVTKSVPSIDTMDIRAYLAVRERRDGVSKCTQDNELRILRTFFHTMLAEEYITKDPTARIDKIKAPSKARLPFTEYDLEKIRRACLDEKQLAIVEMLYSTGCRVSELVGMDRDEIRQDEVIVHGKGNKDRVCYINPRARIALENYLKTRKDHYPALFVGENCTTHVISERMRKDSVGSMLRRIGKRAGVEDVHAHRFRRTAATIALQRGMPIEQVSKMLGHEQIGTTQIYVSIDQNDIKRAHQKYLT